MWVKHHPTTLQFLHYKFLILNFEVWKQNTPVCTLEISDFEFGTEIPKILLVVHKI